jgi:hypothetical protein
MHRRCHLASNRKRQKHEATESNQRMLPANEHLGRSFFPQFVFHVQSICLNHKSKSGSRHRILAIRKDHPEPNPQKKIGNDRLVPFSSLRKQDRLGELGQER